MIEIIMGTGMFEDPSDRSISNDTNEKFMGKKDKILSHVLRNLVSNVKNDEKYISSEGNKKFDTPGKRLKLIRTTYLHKLSIASLSSLIHKHEAFLRRIESGEVPLKETTSKFLCICFLVYFGLKVDSNWLILGIGNNPHFTKSFKDLSLLTSKRIDRLTDTLKQMSQIADGFENSVLRRDTELGKSMVSYLMLSLQSDSAIAMVKDNSMSPVYKKGEVVFGYVPENFDKSTLKSHDCIIKCKNNIVEVRRVSSYNDSLLHITNYDGSNPNLIPKSTEIYPVFMRLTN